MPTFRYQHVNLPWPIRDRHWVILCEKNPRVAEASDGLVWEHYWSLVDDGESWWRAASEDGRINGLDENTLEASIYLAENRGAWIMLEVDAERTLVIGYFDGDLGGRIPKSVVRRFSYPQLEKGLQLIADVSVDIHQRYDEDRPVHDGFGDPIDKRAVPRSGRQLHGDAEYRGRAVKRVSPARSGDQA